MPIQIVPKSDIDRLTEKQRQAIHQLWQSPSAHAKNIRLREDFRLRAMAAGFSRR